MDRIEFSNSIGIDSLSQVEHIFYEVTAMYGLFVGKNYISFSGILKDDNSAEFSVTFGTREDAEKIYNELNTKTVIVYGNYYTFNININDSNLKVILTKYK